MLFIFNVLLVMLVRNLPKFIPSLIVGYIYADLTNKNNFASINSFTLMSNSLLSFIIVFVLFFLSVYISYKIADAFDVFNGLIYLIVYNCCYFVFCFFIPIILDLLMKIF